jgi:3-isopropylmalate/(R)-2-methylmalate dehydratase small subunit
MTPFRRLTGIVAPLDRTNVDTDQIIPKQFLKRIERTGFGEFLFYDWRYNQDGELNETFILNQPRYQGATILVTGRNFGCGSSREHAPWALLDYGFQAIIAPSFADIFTTNCLKNGILPVTLSEPNVATILQRVLTEPNYRATVDLEQRLVLDDSDFRASFEISDFNRARLLEGLDDIGLTLKYEPQIAAYEQRRGNSRVTTS